MPEKKYKILLVEDDHEFQTALSKTLKKAGYSVSHASDGEAALSVFKEKAFDLVMTDLSMPKRKGLDVLTEVKRKTPEIPVIIITAFGDWDTYQEAVDQNVFEYVNKPVKKEEILKLVETALLGREKKV